MFARSLLLIFVFATTSVGVAFAGPDLRQARDEVVLAAAADASKPKVRAEALLELAERRARGAIASIDSALAAPEAEVRVAALRLAGSLGKRAKSRGDNCASRAGDPSPEVREAVAWALARLGRDHEPWAQVLLALFQGDSSRQVRHQAARSLGRFPCIASTSREVLMRALAEEELPIATGAAHGLRGLGLLGRPIQPRLKALAMSQGKGKGKLERRQLALRVLGGQGQWGVGPLLAARERVGLTLVADAELGRSTLGRTLLALGLATTPRGASDRLATLRVYKREVLLSILPALAKLVRSGRHALVRAGCAGLLASLGKDASPAAASLGQGLLTPGAEENALEALRGLRVEDLGPALPWIDAALQAGDDSQVRGLLRFLSERPRLGSRAVGLISDALQWGSEDVRVGAAMALGALGQRSKPATSVLVACLRLDTSLKVRVLSAGVLARIGGPRAQAARGDMEALLPQLGGPSRQSLLDSLSRLDAKRK